MTTTLENASIPEEGNYYQILAIASTASLVEIRNAYEEQLEAAHIEAISAYSLFPEEQTEQKLLQIGHAFVTLANPIARAKYDDEIRLTIASEQQTDFQQESGTISEPPLTEKPTQIKTETAYPPHKDENKQTEEKLEIPKSVPTDVVGQTQEQRQNFYLNLAVKNEQTEESIEEYYSRLRAHGGNVSFNGAVLKQIRELKSITLDELAKITCIRSTYLEAIEEENFKKFTSEIYLKGYLICYVEAMKLPAEQIIEEYINLYKNKLEAEKG